MKKISSYRGSNNRHIRREIFSPKPTPTVEVVASDEENTTTEITDERNSNE